MANKSVNRLWSSKEDHSVDIADYSSVITGPLYLIMAFFLGPLQMTASSWLASRKAMLITPRLWLWSVYTGSQPWHNVTCDVT